MFKISVIIPVFNAEKYILVAISSVLNQTCIHEYIFEIIIINDGSTDATLSIIDSIKDDRIKVVTQENSGVSSARNNGIKYATGDFIAFLDADDSWCTNKIEKQLNYFKNNPNVQFISSGRYTRDHLSGKTYRESVFKHSTQGFFFKKLFISNFITTSSVILKKEIIKENTFDHDLKLGEDWVFWLKLSIYNKFAYLTDPLVVYNIFGVNKYPPCEIIKSYSKVSMLYKRNFKIDKFYFKIKAVLYYTLANYYLTNKEICISLYLCKKGIDNDISNIREILKFFLSLCVYGMKSFTKFIIGFKNEFF